MAHARADEVEVVALEIPACLQPWHDELQKLVALELAPRATVTEGQASEAATRAWLACTPRGAQINVQDARRAKPLSIDVDLADTAPEARPRLLALAITELIATSQLERPEPRPAVAPPTPKHLLRLQLWLGGGLSWLEQPRLVAPVIAFGALAGVDWFALGAQLRFARARRQTHGASVTATTFSLDLAPAYWWTHGRWELLLGAGVRLGVASLRASPREDGIAGRALSGLFLEPVASSVCQLQVAARLRLRLGLELGYITRSVRGLDEDGQALVALQGLSLSPTLGLSLAL